MGAKVSFLGEEVEAVASVAPRVVVPSQAIREDGGREVVFVYDGEAVERRAVRLGARSGGQVEIVAGLRAAERVVLEAPENLADGDRVRALR